MNHSTPNRPSAFKPIGHYPHDPAISLSHPVIARPKPHVHARKEDAITASNSIIQQQRSRSRSSAANRRKSAVNDSSIPVSNGHERGFRAFFMRNRTRSISPTRFHSNSHTSVRRMRTEKPGMAVTSSSTGGIGGINPNNLTSIGGLNNGINMNTTGVRRMRTDTTGTIGKYDVFVPPTNPKRMTSDTQLHLQLSSDRLKSITSSTPTNNAANNNNNGISDAQLQISSCDRLKSIDRYRTTGSPLVSSDRLHSHVSHISHSSGYSPKLVHRPTPITLQPVSSTTTTTGSNSFGTISNPNSNSRNNSTNNTSWAPRRQLSAFDSLPTLTNSIIVPLNNGNSNNNNSTGDNCGMSTPSNIGNNSNNTIINTVSISKQKRSDRRSITVQDATIGGWMPERHNTAAELSNVNGDSSSNSNNNVGKTGSNKNRNSKPVRSRSRHMGRTRFWRFGNRRASMKEEEADDSWKAGYMAGLKAGRETAKDIHHYEDRESGNINNSNSNLLAADNSESKEAGKLTRMLSGNAGRRNRGESGNTTARRKHDSNNNMVRNNNNNRVELRLGGRGRYTKRWNNNNNHNYNYNSAKKSSNNNNSNNTSNNNLRERSHDDMSCVTQNSDSYDER